ncbi:hypothetical protein LCGC14_0392270 [marine sediment metagenome]|uniref:Holliday junction resolvase RuvC n=1 Tax=marine sediment metagenome TaxID=412755 RepID=A0A0F9W8C2_9ZZZZ
MTDIMTVDPSIDACGWAVFSGYDGPGFNKLERPTDSGVIRSSAKVLWANKALRIADKFEGVLREHHGVDHVAIELPKYLDTRKGRVAARSEAFTKLVFVVGCLAKVVVDCEYNLIFVPVGKWNGQLEKKLMTERVTKLMKQKYREHETDAVGIGLHLKGWFPNKPKGR